MKLTLLLGLLALTIIYICPSIANDKWLQELKKRSNDYHNKLAKSVPTVRGKVAKNSAATADKALRNFINIVKALKRSVEAQLKKVRADKKKVNKIRKGFDNVLRQLNTKSNPKRGALGGGIERGIVDLAKVGISMVGLVVGDALEAFKHVREDISEFAITLYKNTTKASGQIFDAVINTLRPGGKGGNSKNYDKNDVKGDKKEKGKGKGKGKKDVVEDVNEDGNVENEEEDIKTLGDGSESEDVPDPKTDDAASKADSEADSEAD